MNADVLVALVRSALTGMTIGPRHLRKSLDSTAELEGTAFDDADFDAVQEAITSTNPNHGPRLLFERRLHEWDNEESTPWTNATVRNTRQRREHIYQRLQIGGRLTAKVDDLIPVYGVEPPTIIAAEHVKWFTPERKQTRVFYWEAFRSFLLGTNHWPGESVTELDMASDAIVGFLSDPERPAAYQAKGLVVGYVQSGKTANFTGVIAKAADAGYRLIIVLGGTLDILRDQTQRRIDKELIGREQLGDDYLHDPDIGQFLSHGFRPGERGHFEWHRLTGPKYDYQSLKRGIDSLEFERFSAAKPLYHPENLHRARARLVVVKKNPAVIKRLIKDFRRLRTRLEDVPALIIDDESDQASINTQRPQPANLKRTATNRAITELLQLFPRGQYVGYTATPFANVFINPDDAEDLFPKDYIVCLQRPKDYMGLMDFVDADDGEQRTGFASNEVCFIRDIRGVDGDASNFQKAIDSFILTGGIKLFREDARADLSYRHHTMLVHLSRLQDEHDLNESELKDIYEGSAFDSPAGLRRLRTLWETDFAPVSRIKAPPGVPQPAGFAELEPFIAECVKRVDRGKSILVVNGRDEDTPNFDAEPVWKILVGGNKLSRGYTVEGLTVSYFRRRVNTADTLMQMGRWFGFRRGFNDLVRLFIGRVEPAGRGRTRDLFADFREMFTREEEFRRDLEKYGKQTEPRVKPSQIPPLVPGYGRMTPTAANKMYNARLVSQNFGGETTQRTMAPTDVAAIDHNQEIMRTLLGGSVIRRHLIDCDIADQNGGQRSHHSFDLLATSVPPAEVIGFLELYKWLPSEPGLVREVEFLERPDNGIDRWQILAFQRRDSFGDPWVCKGVTYNVKYRGRVSERFGVYTEPPHVAIARYLTGVTSNEGKAITKANQPLQDLQRPGTAVFLFYPVREEQSGPVTMGFALFYPNNNIRFRQQFSVWDPTRADAVTVPRTS